MVCAHLISFFVHPDLDYEGTTTEHCKDYAIFDEETERLICVWLNAGATCRL